MWQASAHPLLSTTEITTHKTNTCLKARLHMRFLMRFLMRFRVQNAPDPTLHECLFHEASCGLERKVSHIIWRHPSFEFLPIWRYVVPALRDYKPVQGRLGQVLCAKSHQNRIENRMCKRALTSVVLSYVASVFSQFLFCGSEEEFVLD